MPIFLTCINLFSSIFAIFLSIDFRKHWYQLFWLNLPVDILSAVDLEAHVLRLHSSKSSSQLLIGPIWTLPEWWATKMKFLTCGKACLEDQRVHWWSLLLASLIMAERRNTCLNLSCIPGINVCLSASSRQKEMFWNKHFQEWKPQVTATHSHSLGNHCYTCLRKYHSLSIQ